MISTTAATSPPRRRDQSRAAVTGTKTRCANLACARAFQPSATGRPARYCSPACRQAAHRERVRIAEAERQPAARLASMQAAARFTFSRIKDAARDVASPADEVRLAAADDQGDVRMALSPRLRAHYRH